MVRTKRKRREVAATPVPNATTDPWIEEFLRSKLPTLERRFTVLRGTGRQHHAELRAEVAQELALDLLTHRSEIEALTAAQRATRWAMLADRLHYQWFGKTWRKAIDVDIVRDGDVLADRRPEFEDDERMHRLPSELRRALHRLAPIADAATGWSLHRAAARLGLSVAEFRVLQRRLAVRLGYGTGYIAFWSRRLGEALLGLGADLIRDRESTHLYDDARRNRPDPSARRRRIARIHSCFAWQPRNDPIRAMSARYLRRSSPLPHEPADAIRDAERLLPGDPRPALWLAEHEVLCGRLSSAAAALRHARRLRADAVPVVLGRARLLEARGRLAAATALLQRARRRHRDDPRLVASFTALTSPE